MGSTSGPRHNRVQSRPSRTDDPVDAEDEAPFEGDFYGDDYSAADFPGFDDWDATEGDDFDKVERGKGKGKSAQHAESSADEIEDEIKDEDDEDGDVENTIALESLWEPIREATVQPEMGSRSTSPAPNLEGEPTTEDADGDVAASPLTAAAPLLAAAAALAATPALTPQVYIDKFGGRAGEPVFIPAEPLDKSQNSFYQYREKISSSDKNPWAPFTSRMDWEVAHWAKLRGLGSTAFSDLLSIDGVTEALGLSYKNSAQLNKIIDKELPAPRPAFVREEVIIGDQSFDLFKRDILKSIRALYGDPEHSQYLCVVPERHYADADKTVRLYHNFHTGRWWWGTQLLEKENPGATIIPVILSSDKTQVTLFRNKSAYPVYLTIGNLPKEIRRKPSRRCQILIAYLPTTRLEHITNKAARRRTIANLFHACMSNIVEPLKAAGLDGVVMESGDGIQRRCHPIFAAYVGDYPEQVLVTCTYTGDSPVCECPSHDLGAYPCEYAYRDFEAALNTTKAVGTTTWVQSCLDANIKPVQHPFWEDLPYVDIFRAITPDILHQLLQGVMKHLIGWLTEICGADEIDARIRRLPPNHGMRIFHKGISTLSRVSGLEHKQMCSFILGVITDISLPDRQLKAPLLCATRALLDFFNLARYPIHSDKTLDALENSLALFHDNKHVFVTLGARQDFSFPKLHSLAHYLRAIKLYGTTDNYNTETTERLHIDFAKDAYASTNKKDEFLQMTTWLERREKIMYHTNYITWRRLIASTPSIPPQHNILTPGASPSRPSSASGAHTQSGISVYGESGALPRQQPPAFDVGVHRSLSDLGCSYEQRMSRAPTVKRVLLSTIQNRTSGYGATLFKVALARFVARYRHPDLTAREIEEISHDIILPFRSIPVYHKIKFMNYRMFGSETQDSVHAYPQRRNAKMRLVRPAWFDTALIKVRSVVVESPDQIRNGLEGMRIGRVRVIFSLPEETLNQLFPLNVVPPRHLAYVEWFSKFSARPEAHVNMYKVKRETAPGGTPLVTVLPIELIQRSVHLFPKWGAAVPSEWTSDTVLDRSPSFLMNPYKDVHTFYENFRT